MPSLFDEGIPILIENIYDLTIEEIRSAQEKLESLKNLHPNYDPFYLRIASEKETRDRFEDLFSIFEP